MEALTTDTIIFLGVLAGAISAILGAVYKILIAPLKKILTQIQEESEFAEYTRMLTLKQAIYADKLPLSERCEAGEKYIQRGYNHETRTFIKEVLKPLMCAKVIEKDERNFS